MFDVSGQRSGRRKWIHQFENVISIIYFVDLGCYNEMNSEDEDSPQNRLMESLNYFAKKVVNSR
jgi:guanine nucleotide-binding protein G(i) subunit alpha